MSRNQTSSCHEYPCLLYRNGRTETSSAMISDEVAWDLWLNGRCVRHMTSSPHELDVLAVGYCRQQGLIEEGQAVRAFYETRGVSVAVVGVKQALASSRKSMTVTAERLCSYGTLLDELSAAHHVTHGVHEGALVQDGVVLAYAEDVSRYNVLDRLAGEVYLRDIDPSQAVLVFSGRVPQQVAEKPRPSAYRASPRGLWRRAPASKRRNGWALRWSAPCGAIRSVFLLMKNVLSNDMTKTYAAFDSVHRSYFVSLYSPQQQDGNVRSLGQRRRVFGAQGQGVRCF